MDAVTGIVRDSRCLLALYLRSCKFQLMLLLEEKTLDGVVRTLDALEKIVGTSHMLSLAPPPGARRRPHGSAWDRGWRSYGLYTLRLSSRWAASAYLKSIQR